MAHIDSWNIYSITIERYPVIYKILLGKRMLIILTLQREQKETGNGSKEANKTIYSLKALIVMFN